MKKKLSKIISLFMCVLLVCLLTSCGSSSYSTYKTAYDNVTKNGGMEADFELLLTIDGEETTTTGTIKVARNGDSMNLYCQTIIDGNTITQFSDGEYVYTENGDEKTKYKIGEKLEKTEEVRPEEPSAPADGTPPPEDTHADEEANKNEEGSFDTSEFASEFSSFLEVGKIKELGLLDPISEKFIKSFESADSGDDTVYTFKFSDTLMNTLLNVLIQDQVKDSDDEETLTFEDLSNFTYTATKSGDVISNVTYYATTIVSVPAKYMTDGVAVDYDMIIDLDITFVNPGAEVVVSIPDTADYENL